MRVIGLIAISLLLLAPRGAGAFGIMVNEFYSTNGNVGFGTKMVRDEFIEFVITEATTASDLASLTFGDTNNSTSRINAVFTFDEATLQSVLDQAGLNAFLPGTLIVVKGSALGPQNLTYDPYGGALNNSDAWSIELVAGQGAHDHAETLLDGNINLAGPGEVVWISTSNPPTSRTDTSGFIAALGADNNPGTIADAVISDLGSGLIVDSRVPNGRAVVMGDAGIATISSSPTLGTANNAANETWLVDNLRLNAVPEPSRAATLLIGLLGVLARRRRPGSPMNESP